MEMRTWVAIALPATALAAALLPAIVGAAPKRPAQAPAPNPVATSYAAMPEADRIAIQDDLVWTGDYNGVVNGDFNNRAIAGAKAFQKRRGGKDTGVLNPPERTALSRAAKQRRTAAGWQIVVEPMTGVRLGIPAKLVGAAVRAATGSRWASAHGEVQIETFKMPPGTTLQAAYDAQRKEPAQRKPSYNVLRPDFFVVTGSQGLKKFYVRAQEKDGSIRGFSILYDQAMEGTFDPIVIAMSNAFATAPSMTAGEPMTHRKVEYGTAVVLDRAGHLATSRQVTEECQTITVSGAGPAVVAGAEKDGGLAVLRVYGVRGLQPISLANAGHDGPLNLRGIADPSMQNGADATTTVAATAVGPTLAPTPLPGFAGAAALDREGKLTGIVDLRPQITLGSRDSARATLISADRIRALMIPFGGVAAESTQPAGSGTAKPSILRVICTRK
jgi:hypothetical protein